MFRNDFDGNAPSILIANPEVLFATDLADGLKDLAPDGRIVVCHDVADVSRLCDAGERFDIAFVAVSMRSRQGQGAFELARTLADRIVVTGDDESQFDPPERDVIVLPWPFTSETVARVFQRLMGGASPCRH